VLPLGENNEVTGAHMSGVGGQYVIIDKPSGAK
jgi:hypothetical protein